KHMYLEQPLEQYLDDLASAHPTPGGGSASAISGAMGAALASMVARLTIGKANYAAVEEEITGLLEQTELLRERFQQLMQEDIAAYGKLSSAFKLPRKTEGERVARTEAIQKQLVEAALVPLEMVECASDLVNYCQRIAEIGNKNVLSDVATGAMLGASAGAGAAWMVRINLQSLQDAELVEILSDRLDAALDHITGRNTEILTIVGSRM
ncbi:MAG TPA: cyclodeaminase/cyclohydrolase family protein, partial [Ktedonobacteraceae bacterium]|nr:cyclodeaminase/cyclohydrolase family protein [Ktedonobacteraceae bacterium]